MQSIKILITIILLAMGFLFSGELYMLYSDTFQEGYYQADFYFEDVENEEAINDLLNAGGETGVAFFFVEYGISSSLETDITICGTEGALAHLRSEGIREGNTGSLFFGESSVSFVPLEEETDMARYGTCYFIGGEEKKERFDAFKALLVDKYGGGFPKLLGRDDTQMNQLAVWGIIFGLLWMITLYDVTYRKKEIMIRVILGESRISIFLRSMLTDTVICLMIFLLLPWTLTRVSNVFFQFRFIALLFGMFLLVNGLIHAMALKIRFKRDLAGGSSGQSLLNINYILKVAATALTTVVLAGNAVVISEAYSLYQQKDFFGAHSSYHYYQLNYKIDNRIGKTDEDETAMMQEFHHRFREQSLMFADVSENFDNTYPVLLYNRNSMKELTDKYPALNNTIKRVSPKGSCIFMPDRITEDSPEYENAMMTGESFLNINDSGSIKTVFYEETVTAMGIHRFDRDDYSMRQYEDPVIIYDAGEQARLDGYIAYDVMYDIPKDVLDSFIEEYELENQIVSISNVFDIYEHSLHMALRSMRLAMALSGILLFLEMALIMFMIRLEYRVNAVEMALKKIYGYSLLQRNALIVTMTSVSCIVSTGGAFIASLIFDLQGGYPLILTGIALLTLELLYILLRARRMEQANVTTILKGERI